MDVLALSTHPCTCSSGEHLKDSDDSCEGSSDEDNAVADDSDDDQGVNLCPGFPEGGDEASAKRRADCCCFSRLFCCS